MLSARFIDHSNENKRPLPSRKTVMPIILRKIIIASFILTTVALISTLLYSVHLYYGIYRATRDIDIKIQKFDVKILNVSYAVIETELLIENPSEYAFQALTIGQRFWLNGKYILTMHVNLMNPTDIRPMSNTTFTSQQQVPPHRTQYVAEQTENNWITEINAMIDCPLIGELTLKFHDFPQSHHINS